MILKYIPWLHQIRIALLYAHDETTRIAGWALWLHTRNKPFTVTIHETINRIINTGSDTNRYWYDSNLFGCISTCALYTHNYAAPIQTNSIIIIIVVYVGYNLLCPAWVKLRYHLQQICLMHAYMQFCAHS